jgi:uncharacterized protein YndB with AHSA1/START domain
MTGTPNSPHELVLERILDAPREKLFRCWTDPQLMMKWFTPAPWKTVKVEQDLRPGGASLIVMQDPDGNEYPNPGQILEVVPNKKLVSTDAYLGDWVPSQKPFMTAIVTFEDAGDGRTLYRAVARHWNEDDRKAHEEMGFHDGWGQCATQLEALAKTL